jgi:carbon starvation protein
MVWMIKTGKGKYWFVTGIPSLFMAIITLWSLLSLFLKWKFSIIGIAALIQVILALWIFYEGFLALRKLKQENY